jgi:hypothetical protein
MPAQGPLVLPLLRLELLPHHWRRVWKCRRLASRQQRLELPLLHLPAGSRGGPSSHTVEGRRTGADAPGLLDAAEPAARRRELVEFLLRGWGEGDVLGSGLEDRGGVVLESEMIRHDELAERWREMRVGMGRQVEESVI